MAELEEKRAQILESLYLRHQAGKVNWKFDQADNSIQSTNIPNVQIHIDRVSGTVAGRYKVWIFTADGTDELDSFFPKRMKEWAPEVGEFATFEDLAEKIYREIEEAEIVKKISVALDGLETMKD